MRRVTFYFALLTLTIFSFTEIALSQEKKQSGNSSTEKPSERELAAALVTAKTKTARAALLEKRKAQKTPGLVQELKKQGVSLILDGKYSQALDVLSLGLTIARQIADKVGVAQILDNIGTVYYSQDDDGRALKYHRESLKLKQALNDKVGVAGTLGNIANVLHEQGNYVESLRNHQLALSIFEELKDSKGIAKIHNNIGIVYQDQGDYDLALNHYLKSLEIKRSVEEASQDKEAIAKTLNNLGGLFTDQGNPVRALESFESSKSLFESLGNKAWLAIVLANMGIVYHDVGNDNLALNAFQESLMFYEEVEDLEGIAAALNNIGTVLRDMGDYDGAIERYKKSILRFKELGMKAGVAGAQYNLSSALFHRGDHEAALRNYQETLARYRILKDKAGIANTLANIAGVHNEQKHYKKALVYLQESINLAKSIDNPLILWVGLTNEGIAYSALNQTSKARSSLDAAIEVVETLRNQVVAKELERQRFFEDKIPPYHALIELLVDQNKAGEAFSYAERAKGRVLLDVLQKGRITVNKAMSPREQEQERALLNDLTSLNAQVSVEKRRRPRNVSRIADLMARQQKARLAYEAFQTNLYAVYDRLKTERGATPVVSLTQANDLLPDPESALLEYVVTEESTYLFVLTKGPKAGSEATLDTHRIRIRREDLKKEAENFRELLAEQGTDFHAPAQNLYKLLLLPAQEQLKGKTRIIIVPDDILWEIPFETLQPDSGHYALETFTISYAPSVTILSEMRTKHRLEKTTPASMTLLAVGNPSLGTEAIERITPLRDAEGGLGPIPYAEDEVKLLEQLYGPAQSKVFIGSEAREDHIKAELAKHRILHFATHSILNDSSPMYSNIILSQVAGNSADDGLLEAWEIVNMDLQADMAVLSACETARGHVGTGEGIVGLTWAFFVGGCPTTVVSQWKVADISTAEFMEQFHRNLKKGMNKAEALKEAKLWMIKYSYHTDGSGKVVKHDHPFYWAPFILIGMD